MEIPTQAIRHPYPPGKQANVWRGVQSILPNESIHSRPEQGKLYRPRSKMAIYQSQGPSAQRCNSIIMEFRFRHTIREMRKLKIFIVVKLDHAYEWQLSTYDEWQEKNERTLVISIAAEYLCEILALSETLTSVEIVYVNQGRPELMTGRESFILKSFGQLRRIKHVKVDGVSKAWTQHLTATMTMDK